MASNSKSAIKPQPYIMDSIWNITSGEYSRNSKPPSGVGRASIFKQLLILFWKNWLFSIRSWKTTLLQIFAPAFFTILLTLLSLLPPAYGDIVQTPLETISLQPRCTPWNGLSCVSLRVYVQMLGFSDMPDQFCVNSIVKEYSRTTGLVLGKDIIVENVTTQEQVEELYVNTTNRPNTTDAMLIFLKCQLPPYTPQLEYAIGYNGTRKLLFKQLYVDGPPVPDRRYNVQLLVNQIFLRISLNNPSISINLTHRDFPTVYTHRSLPTKQAQAAPIFIFCGVSFQFVILLYSIVMEKQLKLRQGLKVIGMRDSVYWISWAMTGFCLSLLSTLILLGTGYACQLVLFLNTDPSINILLYLVYSMSMLPLAFICSTLATTTRQAINYGMLIYILGLFLVLIIGNPVMYLEFYEYLRPLLYVLSLLPPFPLSKAMTDIGIDGADTDIWGFLKHPAYFNYSSLFRTRTERVLTFSSNDKSGGIGGKFKDITLPITFMSFVWLIGEAIVYGLIFWYLDAVLPGPHGIPRKWYFPIQPSYWFTRFTNTCKKSLTLTSENEGVVITDLSKSYNSMPCTRTKKAVNGLSLVAKPNEILALLGHNGAGKSTTINMLTGLISADSGDAKIFGISLKSNMDAIRTILGVCPQHDILWADLTAKEHMLMFAWLKNLTKAECKHQIAELLSSVRLESVQNQKVSTFSGGMKRRLSVAIAFLGNPKVVFLDEPTTGMDPSIRRDIWNMILQLKKNRVVIMTTHSMEEADILGDNIVIMAKGRVQEQGSSTYLKNKLAGYSLEFIMAADHVKAILEFIEEYLPNSQLKSDLLPVELGYQATYSLAPQYREQIVPFFKRIEISPDIKLGLLDVSISQTTLEEVFIAVTNLCDSNEENGNLT